MNESGEAYLAAQTGIIHLKSAIHRVLVAGPGTGLRNADIGRSLGIYMGHVEHEGHISRAMLAIMESEGVVEQDPQSKLWRLRKHPRDDAPE